MQTATIAWADAIVPIWLAVAWIGYVKLADHPRRGRTTLMARMHQYRQAWMRRMLARDNRIVDTQIVSLLVQNISFFASSTILIVGGFAAVLGARDQAMSILSEIPFAARTGDMLWDFKILTLIVIFVYAFFKFTWALRQFNYVAIMIGAAPVQAADPSPGALDHADRTARVATRAADHFNKAMRAYYFGLATLSWVIQPWLCILLIAWVTAIIYRREFRSATLVGLGAVDQPIGGQPSVSPASMDSTQASRFG
ncbi:MAG TPA: DUF599 domain-containing protein [Geminicoccaceae bacterium]|nr:DUF599 domain-containing protein [Geminicoccus sp.]HMU50496.1 DUF599 domain-containing protein [Geminicoccaceae bacterium]